VDCWVNIAWTLPIGVLLGVLLFLFFFFDMFSCASEASKKHLSCFIQHEVYSEADDFYDHSWYT
jgi:Leu/Phe-tRNA-protein transferase